MIGAKPRSFIMLAVVVVVMSTLLIAVGVIYVVRAESRAGAGALESTQARAIAWSGLQAAMSQLEAQRDKLLRGESPSLDEEYVIYDSAGEQGVARLLPVDQDDSLWVAEATRVDINEATAESLKAMGALADEEAASLLAARGDGFRSATDLLNLEWATDERFYGELPAPRWGSAPSESTPDKGGTSAAGKPLSEIFTVFAFEPEVDRSGQLRVNINADWNGRTRDRLARATKDAFADAVAARRATGKIGTLAEVVQLARAAGLDDEATAQAVDAVRLSGEPLVGGRVNLNHADREILMSVPGLSAAAVDSIMHVRETLADDERMSALWPLAKEIVSADEFAKASSTLTTRSFTFRVRVGAVLRRDDEDVEAPVRTVLEAVIDCVDPTPRLAMVRDITHLPTLAMVMKGASVEEVVEESPSPETQPSADTPAADDELANNEKDEAAATNEPKSGKSPAGAAVRRLGRWKAD